MSDMADFADKALWAVASGTVGAQIMLWREHYAFRLKVAEKYADKEEITKIVTAAVKPLDDSMDDFRAQVASVAEQTSLILKALQIDIPAVRKPHR